MPNTTVPAAGGAMPALCRIIRLRLAILMLRTARRLSDHAERIIRSFEDEKRHIQEAEFLKEWSGLTEGEKRSFLDEWKEGRS
jgi:hypothetical protein